MKMSIYITLWGFYLSHLGYLQAKKYAWKIKGHATLWARIAKNVKKPPLTVNVIDFDFLGFNVSIWVPWSPFGPKKS